MDRLTPGKRWLPTQEPWGFDMPTRVIKPGRFGMTGRVASRKAATSQDAESSLEHDFLTILEFDPRVHSYGVQPITIRWQEEGGRRRRYTPDVMVRYTSAARDEDSRLQTTLFEVKPREQLRRDWVSLKSRFKGAVAWARENGLRFKIVTEKEIRTPYLTNARFLLRYRDWSIMPENPGLDGPREHSVRVALFCLGRSTPGGLLRSMAKTTDLQAELLPWIWRLINRGLIGCDLHQPLTMASPIWTLETEMTLGLNR